MKTIILFIILPLSSYAQIRDSVVCLPTDTVRVDTTITIMIEDTLNICEDDTIRIVYIQCVTDTVWDITYNEVPRDTVCEPVIIDTTIQPPAPSGDNHYVDKNASGGNNGTSWANAWQSFAAIQWGLFEPGDVLYISGGADSTIYYENFKISGVTGTKANPITVIAGKYSPSPTGHSGRVIVDAESQTRYQSIEIGGGDSEYLIVKGLETRGGKSGVRFTIGTFNHITLDSLTIREWYQLAGIFLYGTGVPYHYQMDSVIIKNCSIISLEDFFGQTDGIYIQFATNTIIHDNFIHIRNQDNFAHCDGMQSQSSKGYKIYNNVIIVDSLLASSGGGGATIILRPAVGDGTDSLIIYNNFLYTGGESSVNGSEQGNLFNRLNSPPETDEPFIFVHNTVVTNGAFYTPMIREWGRPGLVVNNIFAQFGDGLGSLKWMPILRSGGDVDSLKNNILWREWLTNNPSPMFDGNWTGNGTSAYGFNWDTWVNTLGGTGINENPLFVDNIGYEPVQADIRGDLQSGSPAINQGLDIQAIIENMGFPWTDINGNARDSTPDIGAYQYVP